MSYIDPDRIENVIQFVEQQQSEAAAQQHLQSQYEAALERHPDVDAQELADNAPSFGWDFDGAADALREFHANAQPAPRTIGEAVDALAADLNARS